ncbi:MAG: acetate--CoA ligase family protein, partial [Myxococcota bacterium]
MTDSTPTPARNAPDSASTRDTQTTLSEHASKALLADYGVSIGRETLVETAADAARAAAELGFPVVVKLCGDAIAHKTERDLVRLNLADRAGVQAAAEELLSRRCTEDGAVGLLVAEMVRGNRELIAGLVRDPQLGPCVMLGIGGIFAEALGDVVFAAAPIDQREALRMLRGLALSHLLTEPFRGDPPVDEAVLARTLVGLGRL